MSICSTAKSFNTVAQPGAALSVDKGIELAEVGDVGEYRPLSSAMRQERPVFADISRQQVLHRPLQSRFTQVRGGPGLISCDM